MTDERADRDTPSIMRSPSDLAGFWNRLADLDAEISKRHDEGYDADVDRLLDERAEWQAERDDLFRWLAESPLRRRPRPG
jgi:hypothetical protein